MTLIEEAAAAIDPQAKTVSTESGQRLDYDFLVVAPGLVLDHAAIEGFSLDMVGQNGIGNWRGSSMRRHLLASDYVAACHALLRYRYAAGFDCATPGNRRCPGVWSRQLERHRKCMAAQS